MLVTNPSTVHVPPAQGLCSSVGCCMTSTWGCWLGKQGAGGTIENSQGFCVQVSGKCSGSGQCYLKLLECKLQLMFLRHDCWHVKVRIDQIGGAGSATYTLVLLTGLDKPREVRWFLLWCSLQTWSLWLKGSWLVTCWLFWGLASLSVTSFPNPECPLFSTAFLLSFTEDVQLKPSHRNSSSVFPISYNCN